MSSTSYNPCSFNIATLLSLLSNNSLVTAHRFEHTINGCPYVIETTLVDPDRWRAYLISGEGGPTALMPFYGATPQQAVRQLTDWLKLAHTSLRVTES